MRKHGQCNWYTVQKHFHREICRRKDRKTLVMTTMLPPVERSTTTMRADGFTEAPQVAAAWSHWAAWNAGLSGPSRRLTTGPGQRKRHTIGDRTGEILYRPVINGLVYFNAPKYNYRNETRVSPETSALWFTVYLSPMPRSMQLNFFRAAPKTRTDCHSGLAAIRGLFCGASEVAPEREIRLELVAKRPH
jgi:hypothetical protein